VLPRLWGDSAETYPSSNISARSIFG
jgi:hypothetical protein